MAPKSPWNKKNTLATDAHKVPAREQGTSPAVNYGEVQADELEVLKAIYMEDYEDVETKGAWSKSTDRSFKLRLRAPSSREDSVVLSIRLTATYPKTAPLLDVTGVESHHERTQTRIRKIIQNRPKQLVNDAMIHVIATDIEDALEDAAQAREQGTLPSLEDERANAEEVATALAKEAQDAEARRQCEAQAEEDRVLKQMVDEELNRREKRRPAKPAVAQPATDGTEELIFDQPATLRVGTDSVQFDAVTIVSLLSHARDEEIHIGKPHLDASVSAPLVAVKRIRTGRKRDEIMQTEALLDTMRKVKHDNILTLLAYRVDKLDSTTSSVVLCSEFADRGTLHDALEIGVLHVQKARQYTIELLEALDCLHRNGIAHGNVTTKTIYLHSTPALTPKLGALGNWMLVSSSNTLPAKWQSPEGEDSSMASRRRVDIWNLGVVVVQMFVGLSAITEYPSPSVMLGRLNFSDPFDDLLRKLFTTDSRKRPSAFDILPVEFLRTDASVMDNASATPALDSARPRSGFGSPSRRRSRHNSSNLLEPMSRYATDFTEMGRLGKGGFGEAVKARNKLDGGIYAVKKIKQAPQLLGQVLSEVMLLNRLNHPYVVRYFSTWVENDFSGVDSEDLLSTTGTVTEDTEDSGESSSDGPRMEFGFQSAGGLDFVSSNGYSQIQFGDDDDSEGDPVDDGDVSRIDAPVPNHKPASATGGTGGLRMSKPRADSQRLPSVLYIHMEYCERHTLRDLVRRGMSEDDSWRFVRQITEGLAHIHSHGIIHRDLKPDNIFIDVAGNPKIGDFGLATTSQHHFIERAALASGHSGADMTRSVGTALYVAPELRSTSSNTTYNDKVDMYSLGIIFYEMCQEFGTAMERISALQDIRAKDHKLPAAYLPNGDKEAQGKLVSCLISHKPSERPSSNELLRSDVLPLKIEDETIRQALTGLSDPRSPYHQKMMSALFAQDAASVTRVKALAWDAKSTGASEDAIRLRFKAIARRTLENVFRRHGAEETRRQNLFPRSGFYMNPYVVQVLDASGNLLQLPYDLTLPHARELARQPVSVRKAFHFGSAYRDALTGGPPKVSEEVDFDISGTVGDVDPALDDAEVLKVIDEAVCEMPLFASSTSISFHLNHSSVLDTVMEHCRIPSVQQPVVKEAMSRLGFHQWTWSKARGDLRKLGLPDTTLDDLQQFDFRDIPDKAFGRLRILLQDASPRLKQRLEEGLQSLTRTLHVLSQLAMQRKLYVAPLGSVNAKFYEDGMLFQCVLERKSSQGVIAAGGRYDSLIRAHCPRDGAPCTTRAVGVSIGLDPIITHMANAFVKNSKSAYLRDHKPKPEPHAKRCHALIVAPGSDAVRDAGIKLLTLLWSSDISAELVSVSRGSSEVAQEYDFVVAIRHEASSTVRVTPTANDSEEVDVPITSLVSHLQQELREREASKVRQPAFVRQASHHDGERKANVQVLMAQHRSKKSNKYHIVEAAQQRWSEKVEEWKDAPILAVETRDDVVESLRETKLGDAESWRKVVQNVQLNERQYLAQIQDILGSWRKKWAEGDSGREVCIFNFRTGHCIYYDIGG